MFKRISCELPLSQLHIGLWIGHIARLQDADVIIMTLYPFKSKTHDHSDPRCTEYFRQTISSPERMPDFHAVQCFQCSVFQVGVRLHISRWHKDVTALHEHGR